MAVGKLSQSSKNTIGLDWKTDFLGRNQFFLESWEGGTGVGVLEQINSYRAYH
jgi:hypothetical protein